MQKTRVEKFLEFILDNLFDLATILIAGYIVVRGQIQPFAPADLIELISWILAVLGLLAVSGVWERNRRMSRIESSLQTIQRNTSQTREPLLITRFSSLLQGEIENRVENCSDLLIIGNNLGYTLELYYPVLEQKLRRGNKIRIVVARPDSPASIMAANCLYRHVDLETWHSLINSNLESLARLRKQASGNLEVRVTDFYLMHGGILVDMETNYGALYLWFYSFKTRKANRPKLALRPTDGYWYEHFVEQANAIWKDAEIWPNDS